MPAIDIDFAGLADIYRGQWIEPLSRNIVQVCISGMYRQHGRSFVDSTVGCNQDTQGSSHQPNGDQTSMVSITFFFLAGNE